MRLFDAAETAAALPYPALIDAIEAAFAAGWTAPTRHHHAMARPGEPDAVLLLMPAWERELGGVKIVNATPSAAARGLPTIAASYLLFDAATGAHLALMDGATLTARRTAAASALAARLLARPDSRRLLVVGAGRVAQELPAAYAAALGVEAVTVWSRRPEAARALAARLRAEGREARAAEDLEAAVKAADIVSCATLSRAPLIRGAWLRGGQHLDLIGAFTPAMREADDDAIRRARVYADTEAALAEAGELAQPAAAGVLDPAAVRTFRDLCGRGPVARGADDVTLFKSVGHAVEDLAAARLVWRGGAG
jgi:ornithine cyclodeaminase